MTRCPLLVGLPAALLAAGCSGTETGNAGGPAEVAVRIALTPAEPGDPPAAIDARGVPFAIQAARASVRRLDFDLPAGVTCADVAGALEGGRCERGEIRFEGPWVVDLLTGRATPPLDGLRLPRGVYRRVDIRLDRADPRDGLVSAGDPLADATLVAEGTFPLDGRATPFAMRLDFTEDVRFEGPDGVRIDAGPAGLLLGLDVTSWFADAPLAACAEGHDLEVDDGTLIIADGGGECGAVEDAVKDRVKTATRLERDD